MDNVTESEMIDPTKKSEKFKYSLCEETMTAEEFKTNEELSELGLRQAHSLENKAVCLEMSSIKIGPSDWDLWETSGKTASCFSCLVARFKRREKNVIVKHVNATKKAKLVVGLRTAEGEVIQENISVQITPEDSVKFKGIKRTDYGEMMMDFIPLVRDTLTIEIKLNGILIKHFFWCVTPKKLVEITGNSQLKHALNTGSMNFRGVAVNPENSKIAIADCEMHCVRVFDLEGNLLLTYGSHGNGEKELNNPHGLAFLNATDLVIADTHNHRICIVNTTTGKLLRSFGCHGNDNDQFQFPSGIHVDTDSNIIICDEYNCRLQVCTNNGSYLHHFSVPGFPYGVLRHKGALYVGYHNNAEVHIVEIKDNQPTKSIFRMGGAGCVGGQLLNPHSLAIDNDSNLLISGNYGDMFHIVTLDGRYVGYGLAKRPHAMAVLNDGRIICTLSGREGVALFSS